MEPWRGLVALCLASSESPTLAALQSYLYSRTSPTQAEGGTCARVRIAKQRIEYHPLSITPLLSDHGISLRPFKSLDRGQHEHADSAHQLKQRAAGWALPIIIWVSA